jgi:hypothetical protein
MNAIDQAIVGHEYGHLLQQENRSIPGVPPRQSNDCSDHANEFEADAIALVLGTVPENGFVNPLSVLGPLAYWHILALLEDGGYFPAQVRHPSFRTRANRLRDLVPHLSIGNWKIVLHSATVLEARIDMAWQAAQSRLASPTDASISEIFRLVGWATAT